MTEEAGPIKAVADGVLAVGDLKFDCYVLASGERVLSQRGIVAALTGSGSELGAKRGHLERYTAALPAKYAGLSSAPSIEFATTAGPIAKGRTSQWFIDLLKAYDGADDEGLLHPKQRHLAKQARLILRALAGVGLDALIDEATCFQHIRASNALQRIFNTLLRKEPMGWERMWPADVVTSLAKTFRIAHDGHGIPAPMLGVIGHIYAIVLGREVHQEVRRRNPRGSRTRHHQFFGDELRQLTSRDLEIIRLISDQSAHKGEFWARLNRHYHGVPIQLTLDAPTGSPAEARH